MTITLEKLEWSQRNGVVKGATLSAEGNAFELVIHTKEGASKLVATKTREIRRFPNPATALRLLHEAGVSNIRVDLARWKPRQAGDEPFDPVKSERMKQRHAVTHVVTGEPDASATTAGTPTTQGVSGNHSASRTRRPNSPISSVTEQRAPPELSHKSGVPAPTADFFGSPDRETDS